MEVETLRQAAHRLTQPQRDKGFKPTGLYKYTDEYYRIRLDHPEGDKWIRPLSKNGEGWQLAEPTYPNGKPLYRLDEITKREDATVYVVEGEKCVNAMTSAGVLATTSGAADSARKADWSPLKGRDVIIWPDHDEPGLRYAQDVTEKLEGVEAAIKLVDVAQLGLKEKGDAADWLEEHTAAEMAKLPLIEPESKWPDVEPLGIGYRLPREFPLHALPDAMRDAVNEYHLYGKQPLPLVASSALAAISLSCQGQADIARDDFLIGPISLAVLVVAISGERKSAADNMFSKALREWINARRIEQRDRIAEQKAALKSWEQKVRGKERMLSDLHAGKLPPVCGIKKEDASSAKIASKIAAVEDELCEIMKEEPSVEKETSLFYSDATQQALVKELDGGLPIGALWEDEAGTLIGGIAMSDKNLLGFLGTNNKLWDGKPLESHRSSMDNRRAEGVRFTSNLMMQPQVLNHLATTSGGMARAVGYLARYLITEPPSTMGNRHYTEPSRMDAVNAFNRKIKELIGAPLPTKDENTSQLDPPVLKLSKLAKQAWVQYHDTVESALGPECELSDVSDFASKSADNAARIAGLFHIFSGYTVVEEVSQETVSTACEIAGWYLQEALRVMNKHATPEHIQDAQRLFDWMVARGDAHTASDLAIYGPGALRDKDRRDRALARLIDHGYITLDKQGKSRTYLVNPLAKEVDSGLS